MNEYGKIYDLRFGEIMYIGRTSILRVPGGWIFTYHMDLAETSISSVFVPFHNEFLSQKEC